MTHDTVRFGIYVTPGWPLCNKLSLQLIRIGNVVVTFDLRVPLKCDGVRYERVKRPPSEATVYLTSESST